MYSWSSQFLSYFWWISMSKFVPLYSCIHLDEFSNFQIFYFLYSWKQSSSQVLNFLFEIFRKSSFHCKFQFSSSQILILCILKKNCIHVFMEFSIFLIDCNFSYYCIHVFSFLWIFIKKIFFSWKTQASSQILIFFYKFLGFKKLQPKMDFLNWTWPEYS
jgi:hypothetical protein